VLIGLDLDNTIVCYDELFSVEAERRGLIAQGANLSKSEIRNLLRKANREDQWTLLQDYVYGPAMQGAEFFAGVEKFIAKCHELKHQLAIISHRTLHPYLGEKYNLHISAREWLKTKGVLDNFKQALTEEKVFFETAKLAKLNRIKELACDFFVDDLPEILGDDNFPKNVKGILFDPHGHSQTETSYHKARSWDEIWQIVGE
jgi:5'(3')-deoxyribonucleotidase